MTRVVLLADGGPKAGLGHISRVTGLAAALEERGVETECVVLDSPEVPRSREADAIVLDSYRVTPADLESPAPVVVFHDVGDPPPGVALVIDGAAFEQACLRPQFWELPQRSLSDAVESVVVATGAGGDFDLEYAGSVRRKLPKVTVLVVRGPYAKGEPPRGIDVLEAPDSLAEVLTSADLAVVAAGQTMLEAAAAGTPTVAVVQAENQRRQGEKLAAQGAVVLTEPDEVGPSVEALDSDLEQRLALSRTAQSVVDGQGARRVAALVEELT